MSFCAAAQALSDENPLLPGFSRDFYAPYQQAVGVALLMICDARARLATARRPDGVLAVTSRLKSPDSIRGKLSGRALPLSRSAASTALHDIAGLRVVLESEAQVYAFAKVLCDNPHARHCEIRDYIRTPKPSGYRSLHLLLRVPVRIASDPVSVPVEIQLRTPEMDQWAELEHDSIYKPRHRNTEIR